MLYGSFRPNIEVTRNNPYELFITSKKESDLFFKIQFSEQTKDGIYYENSEAKMFAVNSSFLLSWGGVGSSFYDFIEMGDEIGKGKVMWEEYPSGLSLRANFAGKQRGIWASHQIYDGYIGLKFKENDTTQRYGWIHLSATDTSLTLKEYALMKIGGASIYAGEEP